MSAADAPLSPTPWRTMWRLLAYIGRHRRLVLISLLTMIAAAGVDLLVPELTKRAVDGPLKEGDVRGLMTFGALIFGALAIGMVIRGARAVVTVAAGRQVGMSLRMDVFKHIQRMSLRFFDKNPVGVLSTRVTGDVEAIEQFFTSGVAAFFHDILKLALILVVLFSVNARLALVLLSVVPVLIGVTWAFTSRSRRAFSWVRTETARTNAYSTEAISGVRVTRLFTQEARAERAFADHTAALCDSHIRTVVHFAWFFPAVNLMSALAVSLVIYFGAPWIVGGSFTFGEFFQFWFLIDLFFQPIRGLSDNLNMLLRAAVSGERLFRLMDDEPEIVDVEGAQPLGAVRGHVTLEDVHFGYDPEKPVLRGVTLDAPPGTTTALVGPTGAGKTSILNLVSRFYDVQGGRVLLDGKDVRELPRRELRRQIAIVLQDVFLFRGTILENIRLFDETITRERVARALEAVGAADIVARMPGGMDSPVEERGANLSVGERQLLAFARALVHDPAVLVLDEATSSIDTETEQRIQHALDTVRTGRTTIIVAHRLSTIRSADEILVLQKGRVIERGNHGELIEEDGLYRKLYSLQARDEGQPLE